jgi:hypothetical protein
MPCPRNFRDGAPGPHTLVVSRFDMAFVARVPSCVFDWHYQPATPRTTSATTSTHGSFAPKGLCCPFPPRYYDPIRQSRPLPPISQDHWLYEGALPDDLVGAAIETFPALAASLSSIAVLHPRRGTTRLPPPDYFGERIGHRTIQSAWHPHSPQSALSTLTGSQWVGVSTLSVRPLLRPSKLLAPWADRPRCSPHRAAGTFTPELAPGRSPSPRVGYHYGAELGNCAGGSFPRKTDNVTGCTRTFTGCSTAVRLHALAKDTFRRAWFGAKVSVEEFELV